MRSRLSPALATRVFEDTPKRMSPVPPALTAAALPQARHGA